MKKRNGIISAVLYIVIALSGWGTIAYQNIQSKPKIKGEIIIEVGSELSSNEGDIFIYSPYIFLTNMRSNSVYIKSFILEFKNENEKVILQPDYTIRTRFPNAHGTNEIKGQTSFKDIMDNLIFYKDMEVKYGKPLEGFVSFPICKKYKTSIVKAKYKLIITDIFGRKYIIKEKRNSQGINVVWFEHFSGIKIHNINIEETNFYD
jgi:hypothetical protein